MDTLKELLRNIDPGTIMLGSLVIGWTWGLIVGLLAACITGIVVPEVGDRNGR